MRYKLVIFDFDGTLADTFPWLVGHLGVVQKRFCLPELSAEKIAQLRKLPAREVIRTLRVPFWKVPMLARQMQKLMRADAGRITLFRGIAELWKSLVDAGVVLAVVSSNAEENVRRVLGPELAAGAKYLECGAALFGKARRFRRVLRRAAIRPGEAICIGDELRDHEAARAVGIHFGAVAWGYNDATALRQATPQMVFENVAEIGAWLSAG